MEANTKEGKRCTGRKMNKREKYSRRKERTAKRKKKSKNIKENGKEW